MSKRAAKMCKFTNRLFVFVFLQVAASLAKPAAVHPASARSDLLEFLYNDYSDYGYQEEEVHYDQRQKGEENLQLRLDGFMIGLPTHDDESPWLDVLAEEYLNNALLLEKSRKQIPSESTPTQIYQMEANITPETAATPTQVINIPAPKKDVESRQQPSEELPNGTRTKSHVLQLLQMLRRRRA